MKGRWQSPALISQLVKIKQPLFQLPIRTWADFGTSLRHARCRYSSRFLRAASGRQGLNRLGRTSLPMLPPYFFAKSGFRSGNLLHLQPNRWPATSTTVPDHLFCLRYIQPGKWISSLFPTTVQGIATLIPPSRVVRID